MSTNQARDTRQTLIWEQSKETLCSIRWSSSFYFSPLTEFYVLLQYLLALSHIMLCAANLPWRHQLNRFISWRVARVILFFMWRSSVLSHFAIILKFILDVFSKSMIPAIIHDEVSCLDKQQIYHLLWSFSEVCLLILKFETCSLLVLCVSEVVALLTKI